MERWSDYAISIATIHHLATYERRKLAVKRLLQCVSPSQGRILIYVWAIEQDKLSRRDVPTGPRPEDTSGGSSCVGSGRDVFVPWVLSMENTNKNKHKPKAKSRTGHRSSTAAIAESSQNSPNEPPAEPPATSAPDTPQVFHRYYHMFAQGELAELVRSAANDLGLHIGPFAEETVDQGAGIETRRGFEIVQDGWERSNYYIELRCWEN